MKLYGAESLTQPVGSSKVTPANATSGALNDAPKRTSGSKTRFIRQKPPTEKPKGPTDPSGQDVAIGRLFRLLESPSQQAEQAAADAGHDAGRGLGDRCHAEAKT